MEVVHNNSIEQERERIERAKDFDFRKQVVKRFAQQSVIRSARRSAIRSKNASWGANLFSYILATYAVYYFASLYAGWKFYFLMALGLSILAIWEVSKRMSAVAFFEGTYNQAERWKMWFGAILIILVAGSMGATYYGGNKLVMEENTGAEQVHTARIDSLSILIAKAEADKDLMKGQTWRGKIVRDARKQMNQLQTRIDGLIAERTRLENKDEETNDKLGKEHESKMANLGLVFGGLGAVADIVLIFLLGFAERREWDVFCLTRQTDASVKRSEQVTDNRSPGTDNRSNRSGNRSKSVPKKAAAVTASANPIGFKVQTDASVKGTRRCVNCGTDISHRRSDAKYCGSTCRKEAFENRNK